MRRIKEYINKHPKLKRITKILGVIAIVFSFLFNALIIGSLIINANKTSDSNKVLAYGDYQPVSLVKQAYHKGDTYLFTYVDFHSNSFLNGALTDIQTNYGTIEHSITYSPCSIMVSKWANTEIVTRIDTEGDVNFIDNAQVTDVTKIEMVYYGASLVNNIKYYVYYLDFYRADNTRMLRSTIMAFGGYQDRNNVIQPFNLGEGLPYGFVVDSSSISRFSEYVFLMSDPGNNGLSYNYVLINRLTQGLNESNYYNLGYIDGYTNGTTDGYNTGYIAGQTGMTTNPFNLISNAFRSVANILNIQVLPNLTLGVLIFTPLVVTIIIVVVKFIRG